MTSTTRHDALAGVLAGTGPVLLDFDGPVTALMPGGVDRAIADVMRSVLHRAAGEVPVAIADTNDPLAVLRVTAATQPTEILAAVENACRAGEIDAATHSEPTSGAHEAMRACRDAGRPIVIVSNNAAEAIETYLSRYALRDLVQAIVARPPGRPDLMKPDPYLIRQVFQRRAWPPSQYAFVGESVTDVQVSRSTGIRSIGYARTPRRGQELRDAGADVIIASMHDLADGIRRATSSSVPD